jgi:NAD(P)-dependent dehydrogenase (short-subunit alcohol dehydrogenase family)
MRLASLFLVLTLMLGCEDAPPAFPVPAGPPIPIALDVQLPVYTLGTWLLRGFSESLAIELAKYNIRVVDSRAAPQAVAVINLGLPGYRQAIDVYLTRAGETKPAGRIHVPDLSESTLDVAAELLAPLIARSAWGLEESVPEK